MLSFAYKWDDIRIVLVQWHYAVQAGTAHEQAENAHASFEKTTEQDWVPPPLNWKAVVATTG